MSYKRDKLFGIRCHVHKACYMFFLKLIGVQICKMIIQIVGALKCGETVWYLVFSLSYVGIMVSSTEEKYK